MYKTLTWLVLAITLFSCTKKVNNPKTDNSLNATLWMQTAAEYKANSVQIYQIAEAGLTDLVNDKHFTAIDQQKEGYEDLPPAIILDVDETVLDNSHYQAMLIKKHKKYEKQSWNHWISLMQAGAVPGAVEFLNKAQDMGVTIFYVTNRRCEADSSGPCPQDKQTFENLQKVGIHDVISENVLLRDEQENWGKDKSSRRGYIAQNYRVIMLFGDNLGDFLDITNKNRQDRDNLVYQNKERWGKSWFMLANPEYGSWHDVLSKPVENNLNSY